MSYYNLIKENYKFFQKQLKKKSDDDLNINKEISLNENLNGGSKQIKYQVVDFDWDDLLDEYDEDVFLYSTSKDIEFNDKKIKEPTKEEVYDELLENKPIEHSFTGEMNELGDQNNGEDLDQPEELDELDIENILSAEAGKDYEENNENNKNESSDSDDIDDFNDKIINEYFNKNETISSSETNDETDLANIDDIINNYFESFENVQGGRSIDKIKEILADDTEYKNSLNLTGGNFKPVRKSKINRLYPYN